MAVARDYQLCDVCGRHLLRGEEASVFLDHAARHHVCELCTPRAIHEGWIREGDDDGIAFERGRSGGWRAVRALLPGRRPRRPARVAPTPVPERGSDAPARDEDPLGHYARAGRHDARAAHAAAYGDTLPGTEEPGRTSAPLAAATRSPSGAPLHLARAGSVRARRAVERFNGSVHPATVAGIARTLGAPWVTVRSTGPAQDGGRSEVVVTVAWELSWYRFAVDLPAGPAAVRVLGRGTSLEDLEPADLEPNALADAAGYLHLSEDGPQAAAEG